MLKEIYDYTIEQKLIIDKRFSEKHISYYIKILKNGDFVGIEEVLDKKEKIYVPDFGSRFTAATTAQILYEKGKIMFDKTDNKNANFIKQVEDLKDLSIELNAICLFLNKYENNQDFIIELNKFKATKDFNKIFFSFRVEEIYILDTNEWQEYFFKKYSSLYEIKNNDIRKISCITGNNVIPIEIAPKISVGGATSGTGDSLICANKKSFQSYGLLETANATISQEEADIIALGLKTLLSGDTYNRDFQLIHWYKDKLDIDPINVLFGENDIFSDFVSIDDYNVNINKDLLTKSEDYKLSQLFNCLLLKEKVNIKNLKAKEFYFLNYTPCSGRIAFSNFHIGNVNDMIENIIQFQEDTKIEKIFSFEGGINFKKNKEKTKNNKTKKEIFFENISLYNINKIFYNLSYKVKTHEQIQTDFSKLKMPLLISIFNNTQIPSIFEVKSINTINNRKINGDLVSIVCYQVLKLYINRQNRLKGEKETIMSNLNKENNNIGYLCGRLFSIYEQIQYAALGDINSSITNKYYVSCSQIPKNVIPIINRNSIYHLNKLDKGIMIFYKKQLQEIYDLIGTIPKRLSIDDQANFALGYYQQQSDSFKSKQVISTADTLNKENYNN